MRPKIIQLIVVAGATAFLAQGCSQSVGSLEKREERDPILIRARAKVKEGDIKQAAELYQKAIERRPQLARAHLEMGLLNDKHREDYLRAIYHYQRYIELRPDAQKKAMIEDLIRYAKISYSATLPDQTSEAVKAIADLKNQISRLKAEIARYDTEQRIRVSPPKPAPEVAGNTQSHETASTMTTRRAPAPPSVVRATSAAKTYQVRRGDTLSKIASKHYDDPQKWKLIFDANRSALSSPESLRLDQTLVIPNI